MKRKREGIRKERDKKAKVKIEKEKFNLYLVEQ